MTYVIYSQGIFAREIYDKEKIAGLFQSFPENSMNTRRLAGRIARSLCALGIAFGVQVAQAAPAWQINTNGTGLAGATPIATVAEVSGVGFVQLVPNLATGQISFIENGAYQLQQSASGGQDITVIYSVAGNLDNGLIPTFTSGSISLFADSNSDFGTAAGIYGANNGTPLASFSVTGGGLISANEVALQASLDAGSLLSGYLFDSNGKDMTDAALVTLKLVVKNQVANPDDLEVAEIICGLSAFPGPGCNGMPFFNADPFFFVKDGGYVSLSAVPEPGSMALFVAALGGLSVVRRHRLKTRN